MERFKVTKSNGSKHSLNEYYDGSDDDENDECKEATGLLEMTEMGQRKDEGKLYFIFIFWFI